MCKIPVLQLYAHGVRVVIRLWYAPYLASAMVAGCKSTLQCSAVIQQRKTFNMKKKKKIEDYQSDVTDNGRDMQSDHLNNTHL